MELFAELSSIMRNDKLAEAINTHIEEMGNAIKKKILVVDDSSAMLRNVKAVNEFFEKRKAQES